MKISIIAAMDEKRGIGKDNKIPWHIKEDLVHLKSLTKDHVVILGRKSYESMVWYYNKSGNPMPGKLYIIVTRDKNYKPERESSQAAYSLDEAFNFARSHPFGSEPQAVRGSEEPSGSRRGRRLARLDEIFVIGGQSIFEQTIGMADKLYLTIVEGDYNCDTFFPRFSEFKKIIFEEKKEGKGYKYKFLELEK
ncbi:MAG: hypothetical protein A3D74_05030 [Candidatus Levybacteria bacterium RIFCSPHIGHO2_02_FULL_37_13]|nr:MAG: hypothetical protein A3D74_05030 [Candidatus Levybacteria bacterium RIFCSPHIGHO2_02_FULL_37_13]OGH30438.1 MAG: hypothetical protein A3E40_05355 [Candidatus Levybacteria bacterium RIFCSPHIGHO2_12_FULL_37_9]